VVATGGGACCSDDAWRALRRGGRVVWLRDEMSAVLARIDLAKRPLLANVADPRAELARQLATRERWYRRAHFSVERAGRDPAATAQAIEPWLDVAVVDVELGERSYAVVIDDRTGAEARFAQLLAHRAPPDRATVALISDETVGRLHASATLLHCTMPAGACCASPSRRGKTPSP